MKPATRGRFIATLITLALANAVAYWAVRSITASFGDTALPPATREGAIVMVAAVIAVTCIAAFAVIDFSRRITANAFADRMAVLLASVAIFGTALLVPPVASADNAWNLLMARAWSVQAKNPYVTPAYELSGDPAFAAVSPAWHGWSAVYGPLWTLVSAIPAFLIDDVANQRVTLRLICVMGYVAAGLVIRSWLRRKRPADAETVFAFWLLNPVAAFEIANAGHNEGLLLPFLALVSTGAAGGILATAMAGIVGAALVKVWPIVLLPALVGMKERIGRVVAIAAASVVAFVACWSIFWTGPETLEGLMRHGSLAGTPYFYAPFRFLAWAGATLLGSGSPAEIGHGIALIAFLSAAVFIAILAFKRRLSAFHAALALLIAYHFIWLNWLQPWHLLAFLPFIAVATSAAYAVAGMALLGMLGLAFYVVPPWFIAGAVLTTVAFRAVIKRIKKGSA